MVIDRLTAQFRPAAAIDVSSVEWVKSCGFMLGDVDKSENMYNIIILWEK